MILNFSAIINSHRMHDMCHVSIVTDDTAHDESVCLSRCAKMAEQIVVLFRVETLVDPRHVVLDRGPNRPTARGPVSEENVAYCKV